MAGLEFRLLGRVEAHRDGQPVDVGGPKVEQAVLRQDPGLAWQPPTPLAVPAGTAELVTPGREPPSAVRPGKVLVVDDTAINRQLLVGPRWPSSVTRSRRRRTGLVRWRGG